MSAKVTTETSFTLIEEQIRRSWRRNNLARSVHAKNASGPKYEIHHQPLVAVEDAWANNVQMLAVADALARFHAMRGSSVQVHTGWACHGLPIEIAVERALGSDIASYDLAGFNKACRQTADEGLQQTRALATWLGAWLNRANLYTTMAPSAISRVWAAFAHLWRAGRLKRDYRVVSTCPRCATPLSETEATHKSIALEVRSLWLRLPWDGQPDTYLLAWTSDPLALVGMTALAVHPDASYVIVETQGGEEEPPVRFLLAEAALERTLQHGHRVVDQLKGKALRDTRYHPPFTFLPVPEGTGHIVCSKAVSVDRGTGLQPVSPAFDSPSLAIAQDLDLPSIGQDEFLDGLDNAAAPWQGLSPVESEPVIVATLQERGLLHRAESRTQEWALCPHCDTPLLPQAQRVWSVDTGSGSWVVGRDRAWGTPLPIWTCSSCAEQVCISDLGDLATQAGVEVEQIEPHRPGVDKISFPCQACDGTMRREADVVDAAFEAAILPLASLTRTMQPAPTSSSPDSDSGRASSQTLAVGMGDKHLGWLGDITEMAALLHGALAWEQAVALPWMEPDALQDLGPAPSADLLRWAAISSTPPAEGERSVLRPLWQLAFSSPAPVPAADPVPDPTSPDNDSRQQIASAILRDRWLAARVHQTIDSMTTAMDACEPLQAASQLARLVEDLVAWNPPQQEKRRAEVMDAMSRLLAPFAPHLAEAIYQQVSDRDGSSVHLDDWPSVDQEQIDDRILANMIQVRLLSSLAQSTRAQTGLEPDQLLRQAIFISDRMTAPAQWQPLVAQALGVTRAQAASSMTEHCTWQLTLVDAQADGKGVTLEKVEAAFAELSKEEGAAMIAELWAGRSVGLVVENQVITLLPDEVIAIPQAQPGWVAAARPGNVVILSLD